MALLEEARTLMLGRACRFHNLLRKRFRRLFLSLEEHVLLDSNMLRSLDGRAEQLKDPARVSVHAWTAAGPATW